MTFKVIVESDAERDWHAAVTFYDQRESGISHRFNVTVRETLHILSREPERFQLFTKLARKARMPRPWPYSVYFTVNREHREVKVVAIWHGARNPAELGQRLK